MNKIIKINYFKIFMLIGVISAQEFEIDGDLSVTGSVESTTIDSLKEVIENLQSQVNSLQNLGNLQTRTYALPRIEFVSFIADTFVLDLLNITGYDLQSGKADIFSISNYSVSGGTDSKSIYFQSMQNNVSDPNVINQGDMLLKLDQFYIDINKPMTISPGRSAFLVWGEGLESGFIDVVIAITADFPGE